MYKIFKSITGTGGKINKRTVLAFRNFIKESIERSFARQVDLRHRNFAIIVARQVGVPLVAVIHIDGDIKADIRELLTRGTG